jgi:membrane dipeptidase
LPSLRRHRQIRSLPAGSSCDHAIVVDSHDDTTQQLIFDEAFDIGKRNPNGNIDTQRMRQGRLDALFFSIWVPSEITGPTAVKRALDQIDAMREAVRTHPHDLMLATTAADVRKAAAKHKIAADGSSQVIANHCAEHD